MQLKRTLLNMAFGLLLGVLAARLLRDFSAVSRVEIGAFMFGVSAAILHYWPGKQSIPPGS